MSSLMILLLQPSAPSSVAAPVLVAAFALFQRRIWGSTNLNCFSIEEAIEKSRTVTSQMSGHSGHGCLCCRRMRVRTAKAKVVAKERTKLVLLLSM
ncbi:hypothetical protein BT93_H1846 [Corymbia citriodora subsp. variegata]|nr:hypothetical protein BT93_H1846 [Corymbia citriodora subsp. variegata]